MAITQSLGYGGSVGEDDLPLWLRAFAGKYGVRGPEDWKVTIKPAADRTLVVATGAGFGHTVIDTNDATEVAIQLDTLTTGTRWDMIVAHRDWAGTGGTTTFTDITGTASQLATFGTRDQDPSDVDDQPLALVRVDGGVGGGVIGAVIDLRVWVAAGGAYAADELVLQYMDEVGTTLRIGSVLCTRVLSAVSGTPVWDRVQVAVTDWAQVPVNTAGGVAHYTAAPYVGLVTKQVGALASIAGAVVRAAGPFPANFLVATVPAASRPTVPIDLLNNSGAQLTLFPNGQIRTSVAAPATIAITATTYPV